jgi:hypothetical protein
MFLANVDVAIANVAAPSIKAGLHAGGGELELVVSGTPRTSAACSTRRPGAARCWGPRCSARGENHRPFC